MHRDMSTSTTLNSLHCPSDYCNCLKVISIILDCSCCLRNSSEAHPERSCRRQVCPSSGAFGFRYVSALMSDQYHSLRIVLLRAQYQLNMTASLCTRCWLRSSYTRSRLLPVGLKCPASQQWQWRSRRGMASMSPESQHKV